MPADTRIPDLAALAGASVASGDELVIVDVSDTSMDASGTAKNITAGDLATALTTIGALATDAEVASAVSALSSVYQPLDSDLTAIAALSTTSFGRGLLILADAAALRTSAGLVIGSDVEAHDADLTTIAGLTPTNDDVLQRKSGAWTNRTLAQLIADLAALGTTFQPLDSDLTAIAALTTTSFGRSVLDRADAAALRTLAGLVIGTDVQAFDAELAAIAGLVSAADRLPYFTGSGTASLATFTAAGRALVDDADAAAQRTTLGLVIGTDVEAHDTDLTTIAGLTPTNDDVIQRKAGAWANRTIAQLLTDLAAPGTTFQPLDSDLTSIAALATTSFGRSYLTQSATGRPKISGGAALPALPGCVTSSSIGTVALAINTVLYSWIYAAEDTTLTAYTFEVTAAPASNAHVRTGVYLADTDWQPSGAPLLDNEIAVASGFTGQKTSGAISVALTKGKLYCVAVNVDVAMTLRIENAGTVVGPGAMLTTLGASGNCVAVSASQTYGAFPNPGTAWTTTTGGAAPGIRHYVFWTW